MAKEDFDQELQDLLVSLPKVERPFKLCLYKGFWYRIEYFGGLISFQKHFQAQDKDIIVTSIPKSGTTWLKALVFFIVNRNIYSFSNTPLLTLNPHELVPILDLDLFNKKELPDLDSVLSPRLFGTHVPYSALPESVKMSGSKIVYICRNPFDTAISGWHFLVEINWLSGDECSMEEYLKFYFEGLFGYGPYWDHILEYWKASLEVPDKVLFLKYEELKEDSVSNLKRLAEFLGYPFSEEEKKQRVIEEIVKLCRLSNLKDMEVNKNGILLNLGMPNKSFFRKGEVGDWNNYLSPPMKEHFLNIMKEKLNGSGLSFKF